MATVGERLKQEREARNRTIEQIAEASGIGLSYLEAMERDEFDTLPGRAFGKLYVRAYAAVLDFDPQPLIDAYDREQRVEPNAATSPARPDPTAPRPVAAAIARWKGERLPESKPVEPVDEVVDLPPEPVSEASAAPAPEPEPEPVSEAQPVPEPRAIPVAPSARPKTRAIAVLALAVLVIAVAAYVVSKKSAPVESPAPPVVNEAPAPAPVAPPAASTPPPIAAEPKPSAAPSRPQARPPVTPGTLRVTESGVGRRVVSSRLEGEGDRFEEGTVVYFQTRVEGGVRGQAFRHVWIHEGRAQQSIPLRLGGMDWRTYSTKTLYKSGAWTVEARDGDGRVLATAEFTCEPRSR